MNCISVISNRVINLKLNFISGTFKLKKLALQREGYDPNIIDDKMFFYNKMKGAYQPLDINLYNEVMQMRCHF